MCGIAGFINNNITDPKRVLEQMLQAIKHRGPDDRGTWINNEVALGHNRLSIIDLSPAGHQPMTSQCGNYTIAFNGEVYNYKELQKKLPQHLTLNSTTDTEVVLELWVIYGKAILSELRGMFAFAIWDEREHTLTLARDHMGIKPLYYYYKNNQLLFASEMKGILASGLVERKINTEALNQYLANGYVMQPDTFIQNVKMLPPASHLSWNGHTATIESFWEITNQYDTPPQSEAQAITEVRKLLSQAIHEETISDRPLGVFLSGGLDSTVLVAALKNYGVKHIKTFSVGFDGDDLSEEEDAKEAANFYQTQHTQLQVSDDDIVPNINQYIMALDQPSIDGLNTWLVSKVTAKHVTVALSGLGGDELFSGYSIDRNVLDKQKYAGLSKVIHATEVIWKYAPKQITNRLKAYARWRDLAHFYQTWGRVFNDIEITALTGDKPQPKNQFIPLNLPHAYTLLQRISYMHQRGFMMSRLLRDSDAVSMDHSIEVRFPIIDCRLVNLCFNLPDSWKIKHVNKTAKLKNYEKDNSYELNGVKHILYQAFKNDLPPQFGNRPKRGFKMPIEKWMKGGLLSDIENTFVAKNTLLEPVFLNKMLAEWKNGRENWTKVWTIYILEKWVQKNIR